MTEFYRFGVIFCLIVKKSYDMGFCAFIIFLVGDRVSDAEVCELVWLIGWLLLSIRV